MRFALISTKHRKVFDVQAPIQLSQETICHELRCDIALPVDLTDDMWLWVPDDPKLRSFRLLPDGPEYFGDGLLCGRTRLDDCKGLPRHYHFESFRNWFIFPEKRSPEAIPRRQMIVRPTGFPMPAALSFPTTGTRIEARERAYI